MHAVAVKDAYSLFRVDEFVRAFRSKKVQHVICDFRALAGFSGFSCWQWQSCLRDYLSSASVIRDTLWYYVITKYFLAINGADLSGS